jgi:MoaA/NifB/PqqE/SkfB family radical SAM enzyme
MMAQTAPSWGGLDARVRAIVTDFSRGEPIRKNGLSSYLRYTAEIFQASKAGRAIPKPVSVQLEITNECTTGCRMCDRYRWTRSPTYDRSRELTNERWVDLFRELSGLGVRNVVWGGGEPMAHPRFVELLRDAHRVGLAVGILTNGVGITPAIADELVVSASWVRVSQDDPPGERSSVRSLISVSGSSLPSQGTTHGGSDSGKHPAASVSASLANLRAAELRLGRTIDKSITFTIQRLNVHRILQMVDYVTSLGIPLTLKFAHGAGKAFLCSEEEVRRVKDVVLRDKRVAGNPQVNATYLKEMVLKKLPIADISRGMPTESYYQQEKITCFTPYLFSFIDAFGGVYTCCHWYDANGDYNSGKREEWKIGDITERTFLEVWTSHEYAKIRAALSPVDTRATPCSNCTRHWVANTAITRLHNEVFLPLEKRLGTERAVQAYTALLEPYAGTERPWL